MRTLAYLRSLATILGALALISGCASTGARLGAGSDDATVGTANAVECPDVKALRAAQLYGTWELQLTGIQQRGQLTLRQHPEFSESLRGEFRYGSQRSIASGDVEGGEFNLDESVDGTSLYAFWSGRLEPARCGAEIRGTWQTLPRDNQPAQESPFILRRAGW